MIAGTALNRPIELEPGYVGRSGLTDQIPQCILAREGDQMDEKFSDAASFVGGAVLLIGGPLVAWYVLPAFLFLSDALNGIAAPAVCVGFLVGQYFGYHKRALETPTLDGVITRAPYVSFPRMFALTTSWYAGVLAWRRYQHGEDIFQRLGIAIAASVLLALVLVQVVELIKTPKSANDRGV